MNASLNNIDLSNLDDQQSSDTNIQSRKKVVKLGEEFQAFRRESGRECTLMESTAALSDNANDSDPRQTRELDADDFFSLGKYTI